MEHTTINNIIKKNKIGKLVINQHIVYGQQNACNKTINNIGKLNQHFGIIDVDWQNPRIKTINNCDGPIDSFAGRNTELWELSSKFNKHNIVVIHGVGGVGKTQLARKFAADNKNNYNCLFWIQAEFRENLIKQLRELALELDIKDGMNRNLKQIRNEIYDILKTQRALLIFDNILTEADINEYLPPDAMELEHTKLHILITSQFLGWNQKTVECLRLTQLDKFYALKLLNNILNNELNTNRANAKDRKKLVQMLEYMPLSIQIAASYINTQMKHNNAYTITSYIKRLTNDAANIPTYKHIEYGKTLDKSIKMSLDIIRENNPYAMKLVHIIAFLDPESFTKEVLYRILKINSNDAKDDFREALQIIINYSLISSFDEILYIHRNIHQIIRHELTQLDTRKFLKCYELVLDYVLNNKDQISIRNTFVFNYAENYKQFILQYYKASKSAKLLQLLCKLGCLKNMTVIFTGLKKNKVNYLIKRHGLLHCAALSSDIETVKKICIYKIDINMKYGSDNATSLHIACMHGYVDIAHFLIEKGADTNIKCKNGQVPLHYASRGLYYDIVDRLLQVSPNTVGERDKKNQTPLHLVLNTHKPNGNNYKTVKIARLLVENGANPDTASDDSYKLIHIVARNGTYDFLAYLLNNDKLDVNVKDIHGNTPLLCVVAASKYIPEDYMLNRIKLLIKNKANVAMINNVGCNLLHIAAEYCYGKIISYLIRKHNISVHKTDMYGRTPLFYALLANKSISEDGVMATVKLLIEYGANVETISNDGCSLLHVAAKNSHDKIISYLLQEHNMSVDTPDSSGRTPLFCALLASKLISEDGVMATVKLLIEYGANVETINNDGCSLLHVAAENSHDKIISYLIQEHKISVDTPDLLSRTPLYYALAANKLISEDDVMTTVKLLMKNEANIETINNEGCSLLHVAAAHCHDKIISYLIQEHKISIYKTDKYGRTPLFCALLANKSTSEDDIMATVKLLIEYGAYVKTTTNDGCSLLHIASEFSHNKIISYLIHEHNISVDRSDSLGRSPLFYAVLAVKSISEDDVMETIKLLIAQGATVETTDNTGCTILHYAAQFGRYQALTYLLHNYNININLKDEDGDTPLHCALIADESINHKTVRKIIKILLFNDASINLKNNKGQTAIDLASPEIREFILKLYTKASKRGITLLEPVSVWFGPNG